MLAPIWPLYEFNNRSDVRRACLPGGNGMLTARALAKHYAALAGSGELGGHRLLSAVRVSEATAQQPGVDMLTGWSWALGYEYAAPMVIGHGGAGGILGVADLGHRFAFGLVRNRMSDVDIADRLVREITAALGFPWPEIVL
jgi:CubicO group peptidase (beta-lactamase class C family)